MARVPGRLAAACAVLAVVAIAVVASVQEPREGRGADIRFGGMRMGTSWYVFSATLYKLIGEEMPAGTRLEVLAKGGGIANPLLVDRGVADVALSNRATAVWARDGHRGVYRGEKHPGLRVLVGGLNTVPLSVLARADFLERTGHSTLDGIFLSGDPVRVVMKPTGSSVPVVVDLILEALGTSRAEIRRNGGRVIQVSAKQVPDILRNGQADVYFESMPKGHPTVTQISLTVPVRFLDLPETVREHLDAHGLPPIEIPVSWKGQERPVKAVDQGTIILTHERLPEEVAYRLTQAVCENREALARAHKAWANFEPENAWRPEATGLALHPGAERYYRERGWLVD